MSIAIPLRFENGILARTTDEEDSIMEFIELLASSPQGSFLADDEFGFSLMNKRFENIENDSGTKRFWSKDQNKTLSLKAINGTSKNNTYAKDLKESIEKNEHRMEKVAVDTFAVETDKIVFSIKGIYDGKAIESFISIQIW